MTPDETLARIPELHRDIMDLLREANMNTKTLGIMSEESETDELRVIESDIHFLVTPCASEMCESCNRPLWQHILTPLARVCPTDGRPYWRLAWAILRVEGLTDNEVLEVIAEIER